MTSLSTDAEPVPEAGSDFVSQSSRAAWRCIPGTAMIYLLSWALVIGV